MKDRRSGFTSLAALLIGAIIGVIFGLFYAPKSGEETRDTLREKGIELKDRAVESAEDLAGQARDRVEHVKKQA